MDELPLLAMLLASIPEIIVSLIMGLVLFDYKIKNNLRKIILISAIFSIYALITRPLFPNFELLLLSGLTLLIILNYIILKLSLKEAVFVIIFGTFFMIIAQATITPLVLYLFNYSFEEVLSILWLRILIPWIYITFVALVAFWFSLKGINLVNMKRNLKTLKPKDKLIQILIIILVLQVFTFASMHANIFSEMSIEELKGNSMILILSVLLIIFSIVSFLIIKKLFKIVQQEAILETQDAFIDHIESLFTTIRAQRHDFLNHVQVLHGLISIKDFKETQEYINGLLGETKEINTLIGVENPVIAALLKTKLAIAEQKDIKLKIYVFSDLKGLAVKSYKVVKVLGNLIDNAMDAVSGLTENERSVTINIKKDQQGYIFEVKNKGSEIRPEEIEHIFKAGFTTKQNKEGHGIGLAVVKELVQENRGKIEVKSNMQEGTTFTVSFPG